MGWTVPKFVEVYTEQQRAAIIWAVLDRRPRLTCPKAITAAGEGKLQSLPPFSMPVSSAQHYVRVEKEKRMAESFQGLAAQDPGVAASLAQRRLFSAWDRSMTQAEKLKGLQRIRSIEALAKARKAIVDVQPSKTHEPAPVEARIQASRPANINGMNGPEDRDYFQRLARLKGNEARQASANRRADT